MQGKPLQMLNGLMTSKEQCNTNAALSYVKQFIDASGGLILKGWRLLALVLSALQQYKEAEVVTDAALDETAKWEQGPLLKMKAKLKTAESLPTDAVEAYRFLLALVQAQRKSVGYFRHINLVILTSYFNLVTRFKEGMMFECGRYLVYLCKVSNLSL